MDDLNAGSITRRDLLRGAAIGGSVVAAGGLIAACGSSSGSSGASGASSSAGGGGGTPQRGGQLRIGLTGGGDQESADPFHTQVVTDGARNLSIYDPLVRLSTDATPQLWLAQEFSANKDATEWTIRIHKGVHFSDGREVTADDVKGTFLRNFDKKDPGFSASQMALVDYQNIRKRDKYTVTVPCHASFSVLDQVCGVLNALCVVPTDWDVKKPIGSGPFTLESFTPGQQTVLKRNPNYWKAPLPYLDQITITDFQDEASQVNAFVGGQIDAAGLLDAGSFQQVLSAGKKIVFGPGSGVNPFYMRTDVAPFNDVRVRQAFRLIVDRPQLRELAFEGHGHLGNDIFGINAPEYATDIPQRVQDLEQAKSLLKAAGHESLSVQLISANIAQGVIRMGQIFAQQAKGAGVDVSIVTKTPSSYFGNTTSKGDNSGYLSYVFGQTYWTYYYYLPMMGQIVLKSSPFNETHQNNPKYQQLYNSALAAVDLTKRKQIARDMQELDYTEGGYIAPIFVPVPDGLAPNVYGLPESKTGAPFNGWDLKELWMKS
jgi:peptide/nickel transport system substrate-binding protein